ncbi:spidroin-1-like isoform X2 [Rhinatrema bivittatum]|uniref:spidroin-1-like isoform X2 n=1 Tax=Rhinatrema bivittatum TaxID=194408 RepID=UPI001127DABA|nr:spidroin-1-like isoform X2 [Rhinatrema bivittatum]
MLSGVLLQTSVLLCLVCHSLQGGVKPQLNLGLGRLPQSSYLRGASDVQPGAGLGQAGAAQNGFGAGANGKQGKAGYGGAGFPRGQLPLGGLGRGGKPPKAGYSNGVGVGSFPSTGAQLGYPSRTGAYPGAGLQPGYGVGTGAGTGLPAGMGLGMKPGRTGYGAGYGYPEAGLQQGYPNGFGSLGPAGQGNVKAGAYGAGVGARIPSVGAQQPYGNGGYPSVLADTMGVQTPYGARPGLGIDPTVPKYGGAGAYGGQSILPLAAGLDSGAKTGKYDAGQLPYSAQPVVPVGLGEDYSAGTNGVRQPSYPAQAAGYGVDPAAAVYGENGQFPYGVLPASLGTQGKASKYGGVGELPRGQPVIPTGLEANSNGLGHLNGDAQPGGPVAGGYGQLGTGQGLNPYGGKDAKYGLNGFLRYGRRGFCPSGKC